MKIFQSITYYVRAHRGYGYIFVIDTNEDNTEWIGYLQHEKEFGPGFKNEHQFEIEESKSFRKIKLNQTDKEELKTALGSIRLPIPMELDGGFDGTDYFLKIKNGMNSTTLNWWVDLPDEWTSLGPIQQKLEQIIRSEPVGI